MAKTIVDAGKNDDSTIEIDLKNQSLAAFLAWLVPGLGHIYQGRYGKGVLFAICILGTFFYGMYIGGGHVVYASTATFPSGKFFSDRWQYVCQVGVGLPALPAIIQTVRANKGQASLFGDFERPPGGPRPGGYPSTDRTDQNHTIASPDEFSKWNYDLGENYDLGTVFTVIAGLLNMLVICDAYGGPLIILPPEEKKPDNPKT